MERIVAVAEREAACLMIRGDDDYTLHLDLLQNQKCSSWVLSDIFTKRFQEAKKPKWEEVQQIYKEQLGFWDTVELTEEETATLKAAYKAALKHKGKDTKTMYKTINELGKLGIEILNNKAHIGWTTRAHSAHPVPVFAIGAGAEHFTGWHDNSDLVPLLRKAIKGE